MPDDAGAAIKSRSVHAKVVWREYGERVARNEIKPTLRLGLSASFTANTLVPYLGAHLVDAGLHPTVHLGPYNQLFQACLNPAAAFGTDCEVIVLLWRMEDLLLEEITAYQHGDIAALGRALGKTALLAQALIGLRAKFNGSIVINVPPFPTGLSSHGLDLANPLGLGALHRAVTNAFVDQVTRIEGLRLFDLDALQRQFGLGASFDSRQWYLYHQPFSERFLLEMGTLLGRLVAALHRAPRKCIVLDCDNTLWGGVVGEDGIGGIQIGDEFPGSAYRDFQMLLQHWQRQGTLLALASKNNEAEVWEVFEKHSGMVLKREDIAAAQINWQPKAENILLIAKALNIGTDSLVFVDDNPMEIDYMRAARPEVHSVLLPEEPADIMATLRALAHFDRLEVTREDRERTGMMQAEQERAQLVAHLSPEDFQKALELKLDFFLTGEADLDRIVQLINKTNQFNLTTIRRSLDEVRLMARSDHRRIYGLRVSDKFGNYGLTGVVIVERSPKKKRWTLDTLLLSCRVLGRGVETALLAVIANEMRNDGATELWATFIPTARNAPAASFLPDHGFKIAEGNLWRIETASVPPLPNFVTLVPVGEPLSVAA